MRIEPTRETHVAYSDDHSATLSSCRGKAMTWLQLNEATPLIDHDVAKARERLERAISKAWRERTGGTPQPALDPNVPLRIQVMPPLGTRIDGRAWLDNPVLHWETSEIECLCIPWRPSRQTASSAPATQSRARIEVWDEDLARLWGGGDSSTYGPMALTATVPSTSDE
jgi:hypothetical protein